MAVAKKKDDAQLKAITSDRSVHAVYTAAIDRVLKGYPYVLTLGQHSNIQYGKIVNAYYYAFAQNPMVDEYLVSLSKLLIKSISVNFNGILKQENAIEFCIRYLEFVVKMNKVQIPSHAEEKDRVMKELLLLGEINTKYEFGESQVSYENSTMKDMITKLSSAQDKYGKKDIMDQLNAQGFVMHLN